MRFQTPLMLLNRIHIFVIVAAALQSCFTGVESTPKITEADIRQQRAEVRSAEAMMFDSVAPQPFAEWKKGKKFIVDDKRIALVVDGMAAADSALVGMTLSFNRHEPYASITGQKSAAIVLADSLGNAYTYRTNIAFDDITNKKKVEIPFTIEKSMVDDADRMLRGQALFLTSSAVRDIDGNVVTSPKFMAVKIDKVVSGSQFYPIGVIFHYVDSPATKRKVFLSAGPSADARKFENFFSFSNPRDAHRQISETTWQNIVNNRVEVGMSRDECRLALGAPRQVERQPSRNGLRELWIYDSGQSLVFSDGLLSETRK